MSSKCAPVIIPTLCRYEHFKRCIESLQNNPWARYTDLYIGLDYPAKEDHFTGYKKINEYLKNGVGGFADVIVIRHNRNMGPRGNGTALIDFISERYDRYIFSEDDNEFSPNYLEYMNKCLDRYEGDESILAVTGYKYPFDSGKISGTVFTSNVYFAAFGYGTWNKKITRAQNEMTIELFCDKYRDLGFMQYFYKQGANQYCNFIKAMLGYIPGLIAGKRIAPYDLSYGIYMVAQGKKMIFPTKSKVRNWGYDGSGVHCDALVYRENEAITHRNFRFESQELDDDTSFEIIEEKELSQQELNNIISVFFKISNIEIIRTKVAYYISRVVGISRMRKIMKKVYHK